MMYHLPDKVGRNEKSVLLDSPGITRDLTDDSIVLLECIIVEAAQFLEMELLNNSYLPTILKLVAVHCLAFTG